MAIRAVLLDCISHSLELDPRLEDYREQARIAEALHQPAFAAGALVNLGIMLERLGQDASDAYGRAYADDATNMAARLGYGRALIAHNRPNEAIELLEPLATYPSSPEEAREPYALALLAVGRVVEAEPFIWGVFERNPGANLTVLHSVIGGLIDRDRADRALLLTRRLEEFFRKAGRRTEFMADMAQLAEKAKPDVAFLNISPNSITAPTASSSIPRYCPGCSISTIRQATTPRLWMRWTAPSISIPTRPRTGTGCTNSPATFRRTG